LERAGKPVPFADGQIAAVAVTNSLRLVTRNVVDFAKFADLAVESCWTAD
jgi:tRNA(fMet)-specific endonuclease VapC